MEGSRPSNEPHLNVFDLMALHVEVDFSGDLDKFVITTSQGLQFKIGKAV